MDDRLREFGEVPGYEFDVPRASGQPRPGAGSGQPHRQTWQSRPPGERRQAPPGAYSQAPPEPALPGRRSALLTREFLAAMRARNWLTSLAAPLLAAVAVGVACVVVLGANNAGNAAAPSALAAGFPPARPASADFGGGGGLPVEVSAIAAAGATEVAAGSANRGCALWVSTDGGASWRRAVVTSPEGGGRRTGQLAAVAHGRSGWLSVGGAAAAGSTGTLGPVVVGSRDGRTWTVTGRGGIFAGPGRVVTAAVAAGRAGYVIVGHSSVGRRTVAAAWYAPGLGGWRRAADAQPGALDGPGNRMMNAVSATSRGIVAVGAVGAHPAGWLSEAGRTWKLVTLALPAGAKSAALDYVAANGSVVAAVGTEVTAAGQRLPFAAVSMDAGAAWTSAPLPLPAGSATASATALTAAGGGFTATGGYGQPGQTDVVVWTLPAGTATGTAWTEVTPQGTGLAGPGMQAITALTAAGATLTGIGFRSAPTSSSAAMVTEPTIWQSPARS